MDLEHLGRAQVNSRVLEIIKHQSAIDSLCFPEVNALPIYLFH